MTTSTNVEYLRARWERLFSQIASPLRPEHDLDSLKQKWFNTIVQHYSEPQRHYHNVNHLLWLLHLCPLPAEQSTHVLSPVSLSSNRNLTEAAIFFHDIIYDPQLPHGENELQSEKIWRECCEDVDVGGELREQVSRAILATISHTAPTPSNGDVELFLDLDLSILASPWTISDTDRREAWMISYSKYFEKIRKEYGHFSDYEFKRGRAAVLQRFLERTSLFFSEKRVEWEPLARRNLEQELEQLERSF